MKVGVIELAKLVFWRKLGGPITSSTVMAKMLLVLVTLVTASSIHKVEAQVGSPFDLAARLDTSKVIIPEAQLPPNRVSTRPEAANKRNPFDLATSDKSQTDRAKKAPIIALPQLPGTGEEDASDVSRGTFDTILCFSLLVLLALFTVLQSGPLPKMFKAALNSNLLTQLQRESRQFGYILWATLGVMLMSIFAFVSARQLYPDLMEYSWATLGWFVLGGLGITGLKLLVLRILRSIFPLEKPIRSYSSLIMVFAGVLGLCIFPAVILVCFGTPGLATGIAYIGLGIVGIGYTVRSLRALGDSLRYLVGYPFHFLLYLCGLEIGPLAVVFKLLSA